MIKLSLGLVYVLSVKQKNQIVRNFDKKKLMNTRLRYNKAEPRINPLNLMLEILDLSYSTWLLALLAWLGKDGRHSKGLI